MFFQNNRICYRLLSLALGCTSLSMNASAFPLSNLIEKNNQSYLSLLKPSFALIVWDGANGNWQDDINWTGDTEPTINDDASILTPVDVLINNYAAQANNVILDGGGNLIIGNGGSLTLGNLGSLVVGDSSGGTAVIENGGTLTARSIGIGNQAGSSGSMTVAGPGSMVSADILALGGVGTSNGTLNILNHGQVNVLSNFLTSVGVFGTGTVNLNNGELNVALLHVGEQGLGTINIVNGGVLNSQISLLGGANVFDLPNGNGSVNITDSGSVWNALALYIGMSGTGAVTISNSGHVIVNTETRLGLGPTASGQLNLLGTAGNRGVLTTPNLQGGDGTHSVLFDGGILQAASDQANFIAGFNPGELVIGAGGLFMDSQAYTVVANSVFSGVGGLTKLGTGVVILNGNQLYTGDTEVQDGQLIVNGQLSGNLQVGPNSRLSGNMTTGSTVLQGTIAPGNSIGTITVAGNYTQTAGSVYEAEINPFGQSDFIHVLGTATLEPGAGLFVLKEPGIYTGARYTLLTADGGLTGTYSNFTQNMPLLDLVLSYDANNVYLDISRNQTPIAFFGQTRNQFNTAIAVESLGAGNPVYDALVNLPNVASINDALNHLSGEFYASSVNALIDESRYIRDAVWTYLDNPQELTVQQGRGVNFWGHGFGAWGKLDGNSNAASLKRHTEGVFIGGDTRLNAQTGVGVVGGYSQSDFDVYSRQSTADVDNYHLGLYGYTRFNNISFNAGAAYSWNDSDSSRIVQFPNFYNDLSAGNDARTRQVFGELGYHFDFNQLSIKPLANLAYVNVKTDSFYETGGFAGLNARKMDEDMTYSTLGAREKGLLYSTPNYEFNQRLFLGWRHAFNSLTPSSNFAFNTGVLPFTIYGAPLARNALVLDASLQVQHIGKSAKLSLGYFGQFASALRDQGVAARFSWQFA
ncbi:Extracellular serine protease precursor [Legionella birminghamensis]|uniref:Extracellular serine protease n=1 Tax=Legionella birminghamensis TaxID=28083 RepID=A0A378I827_9GAMM|nr:autotransporter domain-containing protein [Legionella birminghamensis]KTC71522.1 Extracellular serine protease precursor [Legionella birminghamensis]STX30870.1 Extracellular serine protease precursor [Legionella birminghamensis]